MPWLSLPYPFWEKTFGTERYGTIGYLLSMMNIAALTFGPAANYTLIIAIYRTDADKGTHA
jgi:hypothetical protein